MKVTRRWQWCDECHEHVEANAEHGEHMSKQTEIPGTEDPSRITEVDDTLFAWLDAREAQRKAADTTKIKHASLLERLAELGIDRYAYLDQFTGKKRFVVVKRDPKAATQKAPSPRRPKRERAKPDREKPEDQVEHRKVSRASVADEIDPFARLRDSIDSLDGAAVSVIVGDEKIPLARGRS